MTRSLPRRSAIILSLLLSAISLPAGAQVISSMGVATEDPGIPLSRNQWLATSFLAASDAGSMLVTSVDLRFDAITPHSGVFVAIAGSINHAPDPDDIRIVMDSSAMEDNVHTSTTVITLQPLSSGSPPLLLPDQEYWLIFGVKLSQPGSDDTGSSLYHWSYATTTPPAGGSDGWTLGPRIASGNTDGQLWTSEVQTPYSFSISLAPVPEPGLFPLLLLGLGPLGLARRRRAVSE